MERPTNIMIWLVLIAGRAFLFAAHIVSANANLLRRPQSCSSDFLWRPPRTGQSGNLELTLAAIADQEEHMEDRRQVLTWL
jgi:hypothetical protein